MTIKQPNLADLETLAREAGAILREGYGKVHKLERKGVIDLLTEVDKRAEEFLLHKIEARFPGGRAVAEEGGRLQGNQGGMWYVDPIDGTMNYTHGLPIFCVSIAYEFGNTMQLGAVYNPIYEEMYLAELVNGATLNGEPIHVSETSELVDSLLVTGFPYDAWTNPDNNLAEFTRFSQQTQGVRRLGSAALDLCYVAAGWLDGFWEKRLNAWDVAAGALIAQEAGAKVTNLQGKRDFIAPPHSILAANPRLHGKMLAVLQE
ncbi:MAG: inositol monophosphatase family protein [Chloroflexi bacterium]|nr:inositol monophosphatase family protein [Chloroflexota bacterium]